MVVQNCSISTEKKKKNHKTQTQTLYQKIKGCDKPFPSSPNELGNQTPSTETIPQKEQLATNSSKEKLQSVIGTEYVL